MHKLALILLVAVSIAGCAKTTTPTAPPTPANRAQVDTSLITYPKFGDTQPHKWTGRAPRSYPIHGIDVARYQGDIDWLQAKNAGVSFAYIKATEGGDVIDPMFKTHWRATKRVGLRRGAYHYFYFCRPADQQARWFIKNVPRDASALPHVLDMEWNPHSPTCRLRPDGTKVRTEAQQFLDILEAHYGRRPVVYTTVDFFRETGIGRLKDTEFWLRSVAGHPRQIYPGAFWTFWQYTGTGIVPGVNGEVDLNVFRSAPEIWLRWAG